MFPKFCKLLKKKPHSFVINIIATITSQLALQEAINLTKNSAAPIQRLVMMVSGVLSGDHSMEMNTLAKFALIRQVSMLIT